MKFISLLDVPVQTLAHLDGKVLQDGDYRLSPVQFGEDGAPTLFRDDEEHYWMACLVWYTDRPPHLNQVWLGWLRLDEGEASNLRDVHKRFPLSEYDFLLRYSDGVRNFSTCLHSAWEIFKTNVPNNCAPIQLRIETLGQPPA